jgi:hypothetical protein
MRFPSWFSAAPAATRLSGRDLGLLLGAWGPAQGSPYDLNNDGSVDGLDLGILLGNFTPGA